MTGGKATVLKETSVYYTIRGYYNSGALPLLRNYELFMQHLFKSGGLKVQRAIKWLWFHILGFNEYIADLFSHLKASCRLKARTSFYGMLKVHNHLASNTVQNQCPVRISRHITAFLCSRHCSPFWTSTFRPMWLLSGSSPTTTVMQIYLCVLFGRTKRFWVDTFSFGLCSLQGF